MGVLPFSDADRANLVELFHQLIGSRDPLGFFEEYIDGHTKRIVLPREWSLEQYYRAVIRFCELSGWSEEPPLMVALLEAFKLEAWSKPMINKIITEGPFRCHPYDMPALVCRVATELPLLGREETRQASVAFTKNHTENYDDNEPCARVLLVYGPKASGKSYTLRFFEYLTVIQPAQVGMLQINFAD